MTIIKQSVTSYSQKWNREFHLVEQIRKALTNREVLDTTSADGTAQSPAQGITD
jgi:hypothetical protein